MQNVLSRVLVSPFSWRQLAVSLAILILFISTSTSFLGIVKRQWNEKNRTVHNGLYYTFEYNHLSDHVQTGKPFDFENARGWRRGPAAYLWMIPFAHFHGKSLSPKIVFALQLVIVLACIFLSIRVFDFGGPLFLTFALYSSLWFGATTLQYRVSLGDINSLLGFSLFPLLGFYFLTRDKVGLPAVCFALSSHFRVLTVAELFYLVTKSRRFILPILLTTAVLLLLGTVFVSPLQGYLYWVGMAQDLLFRGTNVRTAFTTWHENIAIPGVLYKIASGFHFGNRYELFMPERTHAIAKGIALALQVFLFLRVLFIILSNRKTFKDLEGFDLPLLRRAFLLNEFAFASLLTYLLAPEYGNDFLVTLMPAFLFGTFLYFQRSVSLDKKYWAIYLLATFLTLNIVDHSWICRIFHFDKFNRWSGNSVGFICYESINVFLIPVIGLILNWVFLVKSRKVLLNAIYFARAKTLTGEPSAPGTITGETNTHSGA